MRASISGMQACVPLSALFCKEATKQTTFIAPMKRHIDTSSKLKGCDATTCKVASTMN